MGAAQSQAIAARFDMLAFSAACVFVVALLLGAF
jgi:hypothetical protein